jgi:hypothetical protein
MLIWKPARPSLSQRPRPSCTDNKCSDCYWITNTSPSAIPTNITETEPMTDTSPTIVNRTLPKRLPNSAYRVREYLTEKEVDRLIEAAKRRGRNGARDAAAILLAYRHGLRAAELCSLRWSQIDLRNGRLHVNRAIIHLLSLLQGLNHPLRLLSPSGPSLTFTGSIFWWDLLAFQ